ncbi:MAG TPA: glycosyltransferase [Mycobacteriales bacterium]|nr:glycosyltransferase [Mycobacteriales bacterium]
MTATAAVLERVESAAWAGATPDVSVVIASHDRAGWLPELLDALAGQCDAPAYEVIVADDGSPPETWDALVKYAAAAPPGFALLALRLPSCAGPSVPRNTAVAAARGDLLAFTDDDCLPEPGWLAALARAAAGGGVAQGRTLPTADGPASRWDRTIRIEAPSGLWESCNLALPRALFDAVGGFPVLDLVQVAGRGFGEDVALGAAAAARAGSTWAPDAVVRHRWLPGDLRSHIAGARRVAGFPALIREVPALRERTWHRWFLSPRSAAFDAAVIGVAAAIVRRRKRWLLLAGPWLRTLAATAHAAPEPGLRAAAAAVVPDVVSDAVRCASLVEGSDSARTLLL